MSLHTDWDESDFWAGKGPPKVKEQYWHCLDCGYRPDTSEVEAYTSRFPPEMRKRMGPNGI